MYRLSKHFLLSVCVLCLSLFCLLPAMADKAPVNMEIPPAINPAEITTNPYELYDLTFPEDMPETARLFVLTARAQFERHPFELLPKNNEYTIWYYHDNREIGWCSVFQIWCAYHSGMTLVRWNQEDTLSPTDCLSAMEGRVGNVYKAFDRRGRWMDATAGAVPRPGYLIIYGVRGSTPYTHIAIVESVTDMGGGVYELTTVEGNLGSRIRRMNYRYSTAPKQKYVNMSAIPENEIRRENCQYKLQSTDWYVTGFCKTW
ncbi:MAG: CHAP domain-containing protein [Clostridia bacterium]|nr:CHAP domain-containing protein [Clostridia bacterium]